MLFTSTFSLETQLDVDTVHKKLSAATKRVHLAVPFSHFTQMPLAGRVDRRSFRVRLGSPLGIRSLIAEGRVSTAGAGSVLQVKCGLPSSDVFALAAMTLLALVGLIGTPALPVNLPKAFWFGTMTGYIVIIGLQGILLKTTRTAVERRIKDVLE